MKALTLHQPWASLISLNVKTIETRSWSTKYRGPLAIHAGARQPDQALRVGDYVVGWEYAASSHPLLFDQPPGRPWPSLPDNQGCDRSRCTIHDLPLGAIVATCNLVGVLPIRDSMDPDASGDYIIVGERVGIAFVGDNDMGMLAQVPYGDFTPGRFAWLLSSIKALDEPMPAKGHQGLWEWSA